MDLLTAPEVAAIVRPVWAVLEPVCVRTADPRQDGPLREAAAALRARAEPVETMAAVRQMYKQVGLDPTKTRPSSEALWRRVRKGDELPRINSLVDLINWCSVESQLPFGLYDLSCLQPIDGGTVRLRLGGPGEAYAGIRKDMVHLEGRLVLADREGPFGNPTSDSARTMVTEATTRALVVIFAPTPVSPTVAARALALTVERVGAWARS
jgi:DNA/RNA-binding domain of Phe-tRNA-synthetase-like protein